MFSGFTLVSGENTMKTFAFFVSRGICRKCNVAKLQSVFYCPRPYVYARNCSRTCSLNAYDKQNPAVPLPPNSSALSTHPLRMPSALALLRLLSAVLALIVHSSESGCQAASRFGLLALYSPSSNILQAALNDVDLKPLDTAMVALTPSDTNTLTIYEARGLPALSTTTKAMMYDCAAGWPLKHDKMFDDYYGEGRRPC